MKKLLALFIVLSALLGSGLAAAETYRDTFLSGKDWRERMTLRQKYMSLILPAALFKRFQIPLQKRLEDYIPTIDRVIDDNPYIESEDVASIFTSTVFVYEPESRPAIVAMERALETERLYELDGLSPRLIVLEAAADELSVEEPES